MSNGTFDPNNPDTQNPQNINGQEFSGQYWSEEHNDSNGVVRESYSQETYYQTPATENTTAAAAPSATETAPTVTPYGAYNAEQGGTANGTTGTSQPSYGSVDSFTTPAAAPTPFPSQNEYSQNPYVSGEAQYGVEQNQANAGQYAAAPVYGTEQNAYAGQQYQQPGQQYAQPQYAQQPYAGIYQEAGQIYPMTENDRTLRLIAFIFMIISAVARCWLIIPLAWMIPMTIISWGIYKGTKANTTAFGVCSLIFCSPVGGILLLVSHKDVKQQQ